MRSAGLAPVTDALVERVVRAIVETVDPEQIILFGSHARGTQRADSDIDLLIVQSESFGAAKSRHRETVRLCEAVSGLGVAKDILLYSRPEVEYWRDSLNHVVAWALREGEILFEEETMMKNHFEGATPEALAKALLSPIYKPKANPARVPERVAKAAPAAQ